MCLVADAVYWSDIDYPISLMPVQITFQAKSNDLDMKVNDGGNLSKHMSLKGNIM